MEDNSVQINLTTNVFFSEQGKSEQFEQSPYRFSVEIAGRFDSETIWHTEWEANALVILFPYIRAIVSSVSAQSGREPVILPTINLAQMFDNNKDNLSYEESGQR